MNVLAIESATEIASLALKYPGGCLEMQISGTRNHARELLRSIDSLLSQAGLRVAELDAIVFGQGPGSFTGLRVACAVAKGLAFPHGLGLIPVSTLAAIAFQARRTSEIKAEAVLAVIDARMQELYWRLDRGERSEVKEQVSPASEIIVEEKSLILAGVGFENYRAEFSPQLEEKIIESRMIYPKASAMIDMALTYNLPAIAAIEAKPVYIRNKVTQGNARG